VSRPSLNPNQISSILLYPLSGYFTGRLRQYGQTTARQLTGSANPIITNFPGFTVEFCEVHCSK
ncbi:MAG: hypothetical protein ABTR07_03925, partial [Candidatus Competibacter denitrificans]